MIIRRILIIISSIIIVLLFVLVSSISYNIGVTYGVDNAEIIRRSKAKVEETHDQIIKSVIVTKITNSQTKSEINSSGRVVSLNEITISSEVQGRLVGINTFKKGRLFNLKSLE